MTNRGKKQGVWGGDGQEVYVSSTIPTCYHLIIQSFMGKNLAFEILKKTFEVWQMPVNIIFCHIYGVP